MFRRTRLAQLSLWLGLVAWVFGLCAQVAHDAGVLHSVCETHGELIETDQRADAVSVGDTAEIRADNRHLEHEHGCAMEAVVAFAVTWTTPVLPAPIRSADAPIALTKTWTEPARGPPLAWAPKTSPPLA